MNVNSTVRKRRTAEEAKALILNTAAKRLREQGLEGLTVKGVAEEAGMSHATLIHHFGSSDGMRHELENYMTANLLSDIVAALQRDIPAQELCAELFATLNTDGHARLLAWMAIDGGLNSNDPSPGLQTLFRKIIDTVALKMADKDPATARKLVLLVASTAIGLGLCGDVLPGLLGMSESEQQEFPAWLVENVTHGHR